MANALANWTMMRVPEEGEPEPAGPEPERTEPPPKQSLHTHFIDPKVLTFPIVVGLVKISWEALQRLPLSWASSVWLPFTLSLSISLLIALSNLTVEKRQVPLGIFLAVLNGAVIFAAVLGIGEAT